MALNEMTLLRSQAASWHGHPAHANQPRRARAGSPCHGILSLVARQIVVAGVLACATFCFADGDVSAPFSDFSAYCGNPVFAGAGPGHWDANIRERGWILRDGDRWWLWYTGYEDKSSIKRLGLATSSDGLNWTRHHANPLCGAWVEDMMVVPHDRRLYMFAEGEHDRAELLISDDGLRWSHRGTLDVRLTDGSPIPPGPFGTPTGFYRDGTWYLFYERGDKAVWLATSKDLKVWTNVSDEPVLRPGPEAYDSSRIALNQIVEHDGRFYGLYHGTDDQDSPALWTSNVAVSDDLLTWTKCSGNPLFPKAANRSSNILVPMSAGTFRLYTMHNKVEAFLSTPPE